MTIGRSSYTQLERAGIKRKNTSLQLLTAIQTCNSLKESIRFSRADILIPNSFNETKIAPSSGVHSILFSYLLSWGIIRLYASPAKGCNWVLGIDDISKFVSPNDLHLFMYFSYENLMYIINSNLFFVAIHTHIFILGLRTIFRPLKSSRIEFEEQS